MPMQKTTWQTVQTGNCNGNKAQTTDRHPIPLLELRLRVLGPRVWGVHKLMIFLQDLASGFHRIEDGGRWLPLPRT